MNACSAVSCSYKVIKMKANHNSLQIQENQSVAVSCSYKVIKMKANHNSIMDSLNAFCAVSCSYKVIKMKANHNQRWKEVSQSVLFLVVTKLLK